MTSIRVKNAVFLASIVVISPSIYGMHIQVLMRPLVDRVLSFVSNYYINESNLLYYVERDPKKVSDFIAYVHAQFSADVRKRNLDTISDLEIAKDEYLKLIKLYESSCPIFLLGECTQEDFGRCVLSRAYNSSVRHAFEQAVSTALLEKLTGKPNEPVYYTAFGCGELFQDLVIITKTLLQKPHAQLVINIIDRNYTPYVDCRDILCSTRCSIPDYKLVLDPVINKIREHARQEWLAENAQNACIEREVTLQTALLQAKFQQFICWLAKTFVYARISCLVHESAQSYVEYCNRYGLPAADVIAAADIEDEMSLLCRSMHDYIYLCIKTIQQKPHSSNLLLARGTSKPCIMGFSLDEQEEYSAINSEANNNMRIRVYSKCTRIH